MLFNSIPFLFVFFPVVLVAFFAISKHNHTWGAAWLGAASLFFYGWWDPTYLFLLMGSIAFNFMVGLNLAKGDDLGSKRRHRLLVFGVVSNLILLGYFKYANFFIDSLNTSLSLGFVHADVLLPLGISFFTFTQIAFLVDAARGKAKEFSFVHYGLFVTYFPHLIAGPVLHHGDMMPQFRNAKTYRFSSECLTVGLTIFALGLFKKVVLADSIAPYATPVFSAAQRGVELGFLQSWGGALAYTMQLYFDFSGYCDMAIGLSYTLGVKLPINFNSPYKAANIAEFWRRWHMTLSRFLRDYLYITLGGNRHGTGRRYVNLMITMLLGGLWHGAGWNYVIWGGLHGLYLVGHQGFGWLRMKAGQDVSASPTLFGRVLGTALTFIAVVFAWVFFRANDLDSALLLIKGMFGGYGVSLPEAYAYRLGAFAQTLSASGITFVPGGGRDLLMTYLWLAALLPIVFLAPNTQDIMARFQPALEGSDGGQNPAIAWRPTKTWGLVMSLVLALGLLSLTRPSEFLYFQF